MGGNNEFTTPAKAVDNGKKVGNLRIHENSGEVHFHDDENKIKAAVPVAIMYDAWTKLKDGRKTKFKHTDVVNNTILRIRVVRKKGSPVDLQMVVEATSGVSTSSDFSNFDRLIQGSHV